MATNDFIKILNSRIRISTIKKYKPFGENRIDIYYNTTRDRIVMESFVFPSKQESESMMETLDGLLLYNR